MHDRPTRAGLSRIKERMQAAAPQSKAETTDADETKDERLFELGKKLIRDACAERGIEPPEDLDEIPYRTDEGAARMVRLLLSHGLGRLPNDIEVSACKQ